jgi:hypothetical protein
MHSWSGALAPNLYPILHFDKSLWGSWCQEFRCYLSRNLVTLELKSMIPLQPVLLEFYTKINVFIKRASELGICKIWNFQSSNYEEYHLLGYYKCLPWKVCKFLVEHIGFEVLRAATVKSSVFCDVMPCSPVKVSWCFRGTYYFHP